MDEIKGIARVKFHAGKVDEYERLSAEAMEIVRTRDSGTLQYEIFFNEDESEAVVFEHYRDADAAIEHFANISHLTEPIMATAAVTGEVLGTPNAKMRQQRPQALHAVDGVAGSGIGGEGITAARSPNRRLLRRGIPLVGSTNSSRSGHFQPKSDG